MAISLEPNVAVQQAQQRISSGKQINSAADNAPGSAISARLDAAVNGKTQAIKNAGDGASLLQTANGALSGVTEGLQRLRELEVQSGNGAYSESDKALLNKEKAQVIASIEETLSATSFNGKALFNQDQVNQDQVTQDQALVLQIGENAGETLTIGLPDLSGIRSNLDSIEGIDQALAIVTEQAVNIGASQNRLDATVERLSQARIDEQQTRSRIEDADLAKEISNLSASNIKDQVNIAMQAQANQNEGKVLQLLNI